MSTGIPDGLYAVVEPKWVAGFVVEAGRVTMRAPILRRRIAHWVTVARPVPLSPPEPCTTRAPVQESIKREAARIAECG